MKALIIRVRDAGVFDDPRISKSQDKVLDEDGKTSRYDKRARSSVPYIKIPVGRLGIKHVANLLRVLFGQRPIPTLRKVRAGVFNADPFYEELAKRVRVKVNTTIATSKRYGVPYQHYPEETATIRKSIGDSWQTATRPYFLDGKFVQVKGGLLYADRLHRFLGNEMYHKFNDLLSQYGSPDTVQGAIELLNQHKGDQAVVDFCRLCKESSKTSLSNLILNDNAASITLHSSPSGLANLNLLMACGTIQSIEKFSATLYVPVTDEELARINEGTGVATYLEGGLAMVEGVEEWSELIEFQTESTVGGELCT